MGLSQRAVANSLLISLLELADRAQLLDRSAQRRGLSGSRDDAAIQLDSTSELLRDAHSRRHRKRHRRLLANMGTLERISRPRW